MDDFKRLNENLRHQRHLVKLEGNNLLNSMQDLDNVCIYTVDVYAEEFEKAFLKLKQCENNLEQFLKTGSDSVIDVNIESTAVFKTFFEKSIKPIVVKFRDLKDYFCDCSYLQNLPYFKDLSISDETTEVVGAEEIEETVEVEMPNYMVIPHILTSESNIDVSEEDDLSVGDNKILRLSIEKENHNNFCNRNYRIVTCDELLIGFSPEDLCDYFRTRDIADIENVSGDVLFPSLSTKVKIFNYIDRSFLETTLCGVQRGILWQKDTMITFLKVSDSYSDNMMWYFTDRKRIIKFYSYQILTRNLGLGVSIFHFHEERIFYRTFSGIMYIYFDRGKTYTLKWIFLSSFDWMVYIRIYTSHFSRFIMIYYIPKYIYLLT